MLQFVILFYFPVMLAYHPQKPLSITPRSGPG